MESMVIIGLLSAALVCVGLAALILARLVSRGEPEETRVYPRPYDPPSEDPPAA